MKTFQFETLLTIKAENQDEALSAYHFVTKDIDSYCIDWNEVEE